VRKNFKHLLQAAKAPVTAPKATRRNRTSAAEGEEVAEEAPLTTKLESEVVIPEGSTQIEGEIHISPEGDLLIVPAEPLTLEGFDEPITQIDVEVHMEDAAPAAPAEDKGGDLETSPEDKKVEEAKEPKEAAMPTEAEMKEALASLDSAEVALVKAGTEVNPAWVVMKNGMPFATIALADQTVSDENYRKLFASEGFAAKVQASAAKVGYAELLPHMAAKVITDKGVVAVATPVDVAGIKAEAKAQLFNDLQVAWAAMQARLRTNPIAAKLYEASVAAEIPQPEAFVAGVLADASGEFINALVDVAGEVNGMSDVVKNEFKAFIARNASVAPVAKAEYTPDHNFAARLANASVPVAASAPRQSRFAGLLNK
jgi:hypothetical protein